MRNWVRTTAVALVGVSLLAGGAIAQDATKAIGYRQGVMKGLSWHIGPIAAMAKGDIPFDQAALQHHADALAALATLSLDAFPDGAAGIEGTKALEGAVSSNPEFAARDRQLIIATSAAAAGAASAAEAGDIVPLLTLVGGACQACHEKFRAK